MAEEWLLVKVEETRLSAKSQKSRNEAGRLREALIDYKSCKSKINLHAKTGQSFPDHPITT